VMHLGHGGKPCPSGGYSYGNNASDDEDAWEDVEDDGSPPVTTMSNSGSYPVTPVALQLYSSTPVTHHLLRSRSRRYTSVKYDPWSNPYTVLTTPHHLPCLDVSSPCTRYILCLVSFSPDLVYFDPMHLLRPSYMATRR